MSELVSPGIDKPYSALSYAERVRYLLSLTAPTAVGKSFSELSPQELVCAIDAEETVALEWSIESDKYAEEQWKKLLGDDCPPLQRKLFEVLCDGKFGWVGRLETEMTWGDLKFYVGRFPAISVEETLHQLYAKDLSLPDDDPDERIERIRTLDRHFKKLARMLTTKKSKLSARLSSLQSALNNRLLKRRVPFKIVRPKRGYLFLLNLSLPEEERYKGCEIEEVLRKPLTKRQEEKELEELYHSLSDPPPGTPTGDACRALCLERLGNGQTPVAELEKAWDAKGGKAETLRKTLKNLHATHERKGFGAAGKWFVELPKQRN